MAKKPTKPAKAKPAAKKAAPVKAKKPTPKNKPAAKKPAPAKVKKPTSKNKPAAKKAVKPAAKKPTVKTALPAKKPAKAVKKPAAKAAPVKKKSAPVAKKLAVKPAPKKATKPAAKKPAVKPAASRKKPVKKAAPPVQKQVKVAKKPTPKSSGKSNGWLAKQRERLLNLKDDLLDSMNGVGRDTLRTRAEGSDASAFGMHTGDAGSDAYDRDFALSLLSKEGDSLFEIDAALKKINDGSYGICEMSGKSIPHERLEALPFARYTVECQAEFEKTNRFTRARQPVTSLFGLGDEDSDGEEEETQTDSKE